MNGGYVDSENAVAVSGIRDLAKRALLAASLVLFCTSYCETSDGGVGLDNLADALLVEAKRRGFAGDTELRRLLFAGLISARTVDLLDEALLTIPEDVIGEMVMESHRHKYD